MLDSWNLMISDMEQKYSREFLSIRKLLYNEDTDKIVDIISMTILDFENIDNFRIGRDDNKNHMDNYKTNKIRSRKSQFDSSIYSTKTKVCYYFGFDY